MENIIKTIMRFIPVMSVSEPFKNKKTEANRHSRTKLKWRSHPSNLFLLPKIDYTKFDMTETAEVKLFVLM